MELVQYLLQTGEDANARDNYGQTPLSYAVRGFYPEIIELLLDQDIEVDLRDNGGRTPLSHLFDVHHRVDAGNTMLDLLFERGV